MNKTNQTLQAFAAFVVAMVVAFQAGSSIARDGLTDHSLLLVTLGVSLLTLSKTCHLMAHLTDGSKP